MRPIFLFSVVLVLSSCKQIPLLQVSRTTILVSNYEEYTDSFRLSAAVPWKLSVFPKDASAWLQAETVSGDTGLSVIALRVIATNDSDTSQSATINITAENSDETVSVMVTRDKYEILQSKIYEQSEGGYAQLLVANHGGYICFGEADKKTFGPSGELEVISRVAWVTKLDTALNVIWKKEYGTGPFQSFTAAAATGDGYVFVGFTAGDSTTGMLHYPDIWLIKIDEVGSVLNDKKIDGGGADYGNDIIAVRDGFIVAGSNGSINFNTSDTVGSGDGWLLKLDQNLDTSWTRIMGGRFLDAFKCVVATPDGGYIAAGNTYSWELFTTRHQELSDAWIVQFDSTGNVVWEKTAGNKGEDVVHDLFVANDGGVIITGGTQLSDDPESYARDWDAWYAKVNKEGNVEWQNQFGGDGMEGIFSVAATNAGYVLAGYSSSTRPEDMYNPGLIDITVSWIDEKGKMMNSQVFGGSGNDYGWDVMELPGGAIMVVASTSSYDQDLVLHNREKKIDEPVLWILKLGVKNSVLNNK
jgi:hypothetical protein